MPLLRFDLVQGRTPAQVKTLLDVAHAAMVAAFGAPLRDRYQVVHEHAPTHLIAEDTGLGFERTTNRVVLQVTTRPRTTAEKQAFYRGLCGDLQAKCGIEPRDVVVSIVENTDADWSFGFGEAQFLTGALSGTKPRSASK